MNELSSNRELLGLRWMIAVTGGLTVLLGILAFIGWMTDVYVLAGLSPDYIPMAPATAILSIGYGLLLLSGFYRISHRTSRSPVLVVIGIFTLYAFLKFIEYFGNMELTFDPFLFPVKKKFLDFPVYRTSPITGLLFFLCGVAVLIKILGREKKFLMNLVGGLGIVILFAGFTGLIGYIFETPFLYKGNLIPLALLTTIVFLLLGIGLVAMGGERSLFLNQFLGMHPGARMLRIMVPVIIIALLADDLLARFSDIPILNHALISSVVTLVLVFVTVIVIVQVSKIIFRKADKAESENRRIREELQNQNDFLMTVIESLPYPFYVINPKDYSITLGNSASGWKTGIDNKNGYQLSHDVKIPCGNKNYPCPTDIIRKTKKPVVLEHLHRDKEGNQRYVEVHAFPILDRKGNLIQVIEYSIDITERKKLEEELKESEKRYRILVNTLGEGVALADPDERFVFANPEAERIFGVPPAGLTGRNLKEFLPPDQISKVLFETGKRTNEEQSTYEIDIITPGNQLRHLLLTATPLLGEEGKYIAALGIFRNITEQKQMEAEIATFTRELQESNATKDKFFSIIAHDLKNPFNAILGLTDLITEELHTLNKETIQNIIHTIKTSSENAFRLLENLMIWANSQTGKIECHPEPIHLQRSIHEIISLLQGQASVKNIRIFSQCEEEYQASGDKQMIQTVLRNLLSNAIKFTPQGGGIKISVIPRDQEYEISVQDTGLGIPAEDLPKLFRIDSKYSTRGTANEKGTGLGLVLCKEFVEKNGGTLNVTSETGKGSTFSFTLPGNIAYEKEKTD